LSTTTTTSRLETVLPFDAGLLKKGFFVSISFLSLRKGMRRRAPDERERRNSGNSRTMPSRRRYGTS